MQRQLQQLFVSNFSNVYRKNNQQFTLPIYHIPNLITKHCCSKVVYTYGQYMLLKNKTGNIRQKKKIYKRKWYVICNPDCFCLYVHTLYLY